MPYTVRTSFHHPDPARNQQYKRGDPILPGDEEALESGDFLSRYCIRSVDEQSQPSKSDEPDKKSDS